MFICPQRLARNRNDADHWFDYGTFCLLINDITKAEECFKETVSINPQHLYGLLLYGVVCAMEERNDVAETFFEAATCVDATNVLAWTMLGKCWYYIMEAITGVDKFHFSWKVQDILELFVYMKKVWTFEAC